MNFFKSVKQSPPDPIFGLHAQFVADRREGKIDLGAGVYKTENLEPYIFGSVKRAETLILHEESSKNYLPIDGLKAYVELTQNLVLGNNDETIYGAQTPGGTAALRLGGAFLKELGLIDLYMSNPTWANHRRIFQHAGLSVKEYPYLRSDRLGIDLGAMIQCLTGLKEGSIVLLHACCHNPTGFDPSLKEWEEILSIIKNKNLFPFFDVSYQGFGTHLDEDLSCLRLCLKKKMTCAVAVSHSKNFGLYAERCGVLYLVCASKDEAERVGSHVKPLIRGLYSNPPCHGAQIVATILKNVDLRALWEKELTSLRDRISAMRGSLMALLQPKKEQFACLAGQKGMFSYTGLTQQQVIRLMTDFGIYLPEDGRINIAGLNTKNLDRVAEAILKVVEK